MYFILLYVQRIDHLWECALQATFNNNNNDNDNANDNDNDNDNNR